MVPQIKISYSAPQPADLPQVKTSRTAATVAYEVWDMDEISVREIFVILLLNRANRVIGYFEVSRGGVTGTVVDAKLIFSVALTALASSIILVHNHPSGNTEPSWADSDLTKKLVDAAKLLDMQVLDHLIITEHNGYYSFADEGKI